jgi:hypothetical protein
MAGNLFPVPRKGTERNFSSRTTLEWHIRGGSDTDMKGKQTVKMIRNTLISKYSLLPLNSLSAAVVNVCPRSTPPETSTTIISSNHGLSGSAVVRAQTGIFALSDPTSERKARGEKKAREQSLIVNYFFIVFCCLIIIIVTDAIMY